MERAWGDVIVAERRTISKLVIGPRLTLFIGTLGYALYVGALWWYVFLDGGKTLKTDIVFV